MGNGLLLLYDVVGAADVPVAKLPLGTKDIEDDEVATDTVDEFAPAFDRIGLLLAERFDLDGVRGGCAGDDETILTDGWRVEPPGGGVEASE